MKGYVTDPSAELGVALTELAEPMAAPGVCVVDVHATSLNRGEVLHVQKYRLLPAGTVPGWDFAGVVAQPATDGTGPASGTAVFGWSDARGTWAERAAVNVDRLTVAPPGLRMHDASTLGVAALTAHAALGRHPGALEGSQVLVTGANGGVGTFAVQLAVLGGASTTALVRAGSRGADAVPSDALIEEALDPDGTPADLIVESVGGEVLSAALRRVGHRGVVVTLGRTTEVESSLPPGWFQKHAQLHGLLFATDYEAKGSTAAALDLLADLVMAGKLRTNITATFHAVELEAAMSALLNREVSGKAVIAWDDVALSG